ncbi:hypothetical protein RND81_03G166900 [Saponaria officinalis]|uniref:Protein kinase domain-containing protein n=1 Tax=Saponaria officinalis TaxID=3572 RepID=A0AAW1M8R1_SAPOF
MEQFRQIGEVIGSMKALTVLQDDNQINKRQCFLLYDMFNLAFDTLSDEIKQNLKLEEKSMKWKPLEQPLKALHRVFRDAEMYMKQCMDDKDWWVKAINFHNNHDCVELHIHNLLCYFPIVIEAIETAGEISGLDIDEMKKKRIMLSNKYDQTWNDPKLFRWKYGKQYLISEEICRRLNSSFKEDQWVLLEMIKEKKTSPLCPLTKQEHRLCDLLTKKINGVESLFSTMVLTGAKDYQVRRRLGGEMQYKEIQWLGESYAMRHFFGEPGLINNLNNEIYTLLSISHPNVVQYLCGFHEEEKNEYFLVMELINKDLSGYIKEVCGLKRQIPFSLPAAVDIMLQVARGMEYLHSQKIYHGDLKPSNILIKPKTSSLEGYFTAKISGFGLKGVKAATSRSSTPPQTETLPFIWYAPEVLTEQERPGSSCKNKYSEKADVYSFGMLCFELLTGKVPFEDGHLQGDKMSRNIRAGERPLFPFALPKYLASLTKKCWQTDPSQRPSFRSICRILRYVKRLIVLNPHLAHPEIPSIIQVDFCEIESGFVKKFQADGGAADVTSVLQIPFQLFSYRLAEKEKLNCSIRENNWDSHSEVVLPTNMDDNVNVQENGFSATRDTRSVCSDVPDNRHLIFKKGRVVPDDQFLRKRDTLSVCSEIPEKKVSSLRKSNSISTFRSSPLVQRSSCTETSGKRPSPLQKCNTIPFSQKSDTRSVCSEIPEKRAPDRKFPYLRKYNSVRSTKDQGKTTGQKKGASTLNPQTQSTRTMAEKQPSTPHRTCGCKHKHAGHLTDSGDSLA